MPGWLKALLIVVIVVVVLALCGVGFGVFYFVKNKDAWLAQAKEVAEEGKRFGNGTDNQGCVDEGLRRYKETPGIKGLLADSIFIRTCLESSRATPGFCDEVPKQTEFIKSAEWKLSQCRAAGLQSDSNCQNLFTPVQQFCEERGRSSRSGGASQ
ncbi:MAG TPA: hypothetical protein VE961_17280 [Pyrinomonadaceae bacterium]|nr:hypothetical protein [Pyrinomonadaceae bacterium]